MGLRHVAGGGGVEEPEYAKKHPDSESMYDMLQMIEDIPRMEIRPTGLLDPTIEVRGTEGQVADLLSEINSNYFSGKGGYESNGLFSQSILRYITAQKQDTEDDGTGLNEMKAIETIDQSMFLWLHYYERLMMFKGKKPSFLSSTCTLFHQLVSLLRQLLLFGKQPVRVTARSQRNMQTLLFCIGSPSNKTSFICIVSTNLFH